MASLLDLWEFPWQGLDVGVGCHQAHQVLFSTAIPDEAKDFLNQKVK